VPQTIGPNDKRAAGISVLLNGPVHFDYLVRLTDAGAALMARRTTADDDSSFGIVMFAAADEPPVRATVIHAVLFPLCVATWLVRGRQAA
jgi:hypothetical protein